MSCMRFYECFETLILQPLINANVHDYKPAHEPTFYENYKIMLIFAFIGLISLLSIKNLKDLQCFNKLIKLFDLCNNKRMRVIELKQNKTLKKSASVCPLGTKHYSKENIQEKIKKFKKKAHLHFNSFIKHRKTLLKPIQPLDIPLKNYDFTEKCSKASKYIVPIEEIHPIEVNPIKLKNSPNTDSVDPYQNHKETLETCNSVFEPDLKLTFILNEDSNEKDFDLLIVKNCSKTFQGSFKKLDFDENKIHACATSTDKKVLEIKLSSLKEIHKNISMQSNEHEKEMLKMAILGLLARETNNNSNLLKYSVTCKS